MQRDTLADTTTARILLSALATIAMVVASIGRLQAQVACNPSDKPSSITLQTVFPAPDPLVVGGTDAVLSLTITYPATGQSADPNNPLGVEIIEPQSVLVNWGGAELPVDTLNPASSPDSDNNRTQTMQASVAPVLLASAQTGIEIRVKARFCSLAAARVSSPQFLDVVTPVPSTQELFVPVVLSTMGLKNSFFTSELTLTNKGQASVMLELTYTASLGAGTGMAMDSLAPGQRIEGNAIEYLRGLGIPLPDSGPRVGTLRIRAFDVPFPTDIAATVRTATIVPDGLGRAGLSYPGILISEGFSDPVYICGLRQDSTDRSNLALQNMGSSAQGDIQLRVTVFSGDPGTPNQQTLEVALSPGGFHQFTGILTMQVLQQAEFTNGYVRVERIGGTAPYYAYGVINDQSNSDGSFIPAISEASLQGRTSQTLPVIVETALFNSELVVTNFSPTAKTLRLDFVADAIHSANNTATFSMILQSGEQVIRPDFVNFLRGQGTTGIGPAGLTYAGALMATVETGDMSGIVLGARTSAAGGGGRYGLFYNGVPQGTAFSTSAWLYGLQQDVDDRTNLALINTGQVDTGNNLFSIDLYDGATGDLVTTVPEFNLQARGWLQIDRILAVYAPGVSNGFARVRKIAGANPFIAYAVVNDGGQPGERTGDGAFVLAVPR